MKKIFTILAAIIVAASTTNVFGLSRKTVNKNDTSVETEAVELNAKENAAANISFVIWIDEEISVKCVDLRVVLFAKERETIDVNGALLVGRKGDNPDNILIYDTPTFNNRGKTRNGNLYTCSVDYCDIDTDAFFRSNKIRVQTCNGNVDIEISGNNMRDLQKKYEKALKKADEIYKVKTDATYGF